jgi:ribosome-binding factor A
MANWRVPKVNQLIIKELSQIIKREIEFPPDVLVTLTRVDTTPDLEEARVFVSTLPEKEEKTVLIILTKCVYLLQQLLNRRLRMRPIPRIIFVPETETVSAAKIEEILAGLQEKKK